MYIAPLTKNTMRMHYAHKGDAYRHIPRTSTIATSATWIPSVRSLDCSDEALSKRLFYKCSDSHYSHPMPALQGGIASLGSAWTSIVLMRWRTRPSVTFWRQTAEIGCKITKFLWNGTTQYKKSCKKRRNFNFSKTKNRELFNNTAKLFCYKTTGELV